MTLLISSKPARLLMIVGSLVMAPSVFADDFDELDERIDALESRLSESASGGLPGLVEDVQQLQEEIRELRGDIERLQYESEQQRLRQRDMNLDIEKRLSALEKGTAARAPQTVEAPAAPAPKSPATGPAPTDGSEATGEPPTGPSNPEQPAETQPAEPTPPVITLNEQDEYLKAFELLKQGNYDASITAFDTFLSRFPDGNYADNARYWLAETYYVKKNYPVALEHFERLLADHPDSSKLPGALLKIGYIQYELRNNAEARLALERVRSEFADSNVAALAKQRLDRMDREGR